ncbi:transposase [candidate division WOR-3 bacterium]|nr:transposase [candidate division WOR-3 bacterium]
MSFYKKKYRVESSRLKSWDYASTGYYFVTVCTKDKKCYFGNVTEKEIRLSEIGEVVQGFWLKIPEHFGNVELDEYVMMPNHLHGILIIEKGKNCRDEALPRLYTGKYPNMSRISPKAVSLSVIIGSYKSICTKKIRNSGVTSYSWQSGFYDHIIRNRKSLLKIREYIINNPLRWQYDQENPEGSPDGFEKEFWRFLPVSVGAFNRTSYRNDI